MVAGTYKIVKDKGIHKIKTDMTHNGARLKSWYRLLKDETGYYLEAPFPAWRSSCVPPPAPPVNLAVRLQRCG